MKSITFLVILFFITLVTFSQSRWDNVFGLPNKKEAFRDIIELYDKGYFVVSGEITEQYTWGVKTDINGNPLWNKTIGNIDSMFSAVTAIQNMDGGLVMVGGYRESSEIHGEMIIRLDGCGEKLWCSYLETYNYTSGHFWDIILLKNSNFLVLGRLGTPEQIEQVYLFCYSQEGELLWTKPYATKYDYPEIGFATGRDLYHFNDYYLISGYCYWPYPDNPEIYYLHPMIIKVDSDFNEEWVLPYGINDSVFGLLQGVLPLSESEYMGYGKCLEDQDTRALIIQFDEESNETAYTIVPNEAIDPPTRFNLIQGAVQITDSTFIAAANWGPEEQGGNPNGEYIFDLSGNIFQYNSRPNSAGKSRVIKTSDGNYLFGTYYKNGNDYDIYLYKLDSNLQSVPIDTNTYTYDSLCPGSIQSGYISLEDCGIITSMQDTPSPQEYYASLKTIPISTFPNPAKDKITFAFENTAKHENIQLEIYNIFGQKVHEQKIYTGQLEAKADVSGWGKGFMLWLSRAMGKLLGEQSLLWNEWIHSEKRRNSQR
ncbi:MAG: T9SS type A sorting domain-containing protein [Bacteroidota bacterium]|nr:T9SS type A sorting domain-containing protein [Bacteroidota bacterium]